MLIQSLEQKTRLALTTVVFTIVGSVLVCCFVIFMAFRYVTAEKANIYVLDGDIPFLAQRSTLESNFDIEAKAHVNQFHAFFFNLPPDDSFIKYSMGKALYLADESAIRQKKAMDESGFFSDLIASSAYSTLLCDSISLNHSERTFTYYGTQMIRRKTNMQKRRLVTTGSLQTVPRSHNNPHGLMISNWRTIENTDLAY